MYDKIVIAKRENKEIKELLHKSPLSDSLQMEFTAC